MSPSPPLARLKSLLGLKSAGGVWRLLALIFALLNLKTWPLVWHIRLASTLLRHIFLSPPSFTPRTAPRALFAPIISSTRSPLLECDYNLHKSNSTYFSDLDIARSHLVTALCARGMGLVHQAMRSEESQAGKKTEGQAPGAGGVVKVMLGGVHAAFRREVGIYQPYDIWTRVLAWDRKWLYLVSHFVQPGAVKPRKYILQPWKRGAERKGARTEEDNGQGNGAGVGTAEGVGTGAPHQAIFASSVAKYVFKRGRRTIPPERILQASALLPREPSSSASAATTASASASVSADPETGLTATAPLQNPAVDAVDTVEALLDASLRPAIRDEGAGGGEGESKDWSWESVEKERLRGMKVAALMGALDEGLVGEFRARGEKGGDGGKVLGMYWG